MDPLIAPALRELILHDRRYRDLSADHRATVHQVLLFTDLETGVAELTDEMWAALSADRCRRTVTNHLRAIERRGLIEYSPGGGRGRRGSVLLRYDDFGVEPWRVAECET